MATYAIGDVQGCHRELMELLAAVDFEPCVDRLWLTGDLVNRGPRSLEVVREVMRLGDSAITVLGNHDLHLLALALLPDRALRRRDTVDDVLAAPDREAIVEWLRRRPLMHVDPARGTAMVHAGIAPQWSIGEARARATEVESVLGDPARAREFLHAMYGDSPQRWRDELSGGARLRFITNCFTRMRFCDSEGGLDLAEKGAPEGQRGDLVPWYAVEGRRSRDITIVFGHWSTLRLSAAECRAHNVYPLDTGAVWGGELTALRLEDHTRFSVSSSLALAHE